MEWKYVKSLKSEDLVNEFECLVKYSFPDSFRTCVIENNGGRPNKRTFDTNVRRERELKSFLSFNKEDKETVWKIQEWNTNELEDRYIAFGIDNFGNLICFDANNDHIIFINLEKGSIESIAHDFDSFLKGLY